MMMMSPGQNDVDVGPLGNDDGDVVQSCIRIADYHRILFSYWSGESPCLPTARCRLPSVILSRVAPQSMAAVALPPSPYNVTISIPVIESPLTPLSPECECCGDSCVVAGEAGDLDGHVLDIEGGVAGGSGSASNPGMCR